MTTRYPQEIKQLLAEFEANPTAETFFPAFDALWEVDKDMAYNLWEAWRKIVLLRQAGIRPNVADLEDAE